MFVYEAWGKLNPLFCEGHVEHFVMHRLHLPGITATILITYKTACILSEMGELHEAFQKCTWTKLIEMMVRYKKNNSCSKEKQSEQLHAYKHEYHVLVMSGWESIERKTIWWDREMPLNYCTHPHCILSEDSAMARGLWICTVLFN